MLGQNEHMLMKSKTLSRLLFSAALICPFGAFAADVPATPPAEATAPAQAAAEQPKRTVFWVSECDVSAPMDVPAPVFGDIKNLKDKTYDSEAALRTVIPNSGQLKFAPVVAGEDKFLTPEGAAVPAEGAPSQLRVYRFFITSQSFTKAKIMVTTPQYCEVYVDGVKKADKLNAQDANDKAATVNVDVSLEMRRYEVIVKMLSRAEDKAAPALKLEVSAEKDDDKAGIAFPKAGDLRPLTIADVNEGENVSGNTLSPNGKYVLNSYSELMADASSRSRMEVRDLASGEVVFFANGNDYAWMPNGARLYSRKTKNGKASYVVYDLETRETTTVAEDLPSDCSYTWLPDESGFIVSKTEKWTDPTDNFKRVINLSDRTGNFRNRTFLYLYKFADGVMRPLTAGSKTTALQSVSRDSKAILFTTREIDYSLPEFGKNSLYMLHLDTMTTELLVDQDPYDFSAAFSPDGKKVVLVGGPNCFGGIGRNVPEGMIANSFDKQAFILDLATNKITPITRDFNPSILAARWAGDGAIYLSTEDGDLKSVFRYVPEDGTFTKLNVPSEAVYAFSISHNPKEFVPVATALGQSSLVPAKAFVIDLKKNESKEYIASRTELTTEVAMPAEATWNFTSSAGTEIAGQYFLPPNFDPNKKYPMIVYYYGGTTPVTRSFGAHYSFPLWASKGYVVYVLQPSGATGFGQEFSATHVNAWGKRTADDIIEGVKKFCAEHPFVNAEKVGCIGASYGGFMTMYLQTRSDIFAAAVAHAGISDITSYWGEGYWGAAYNAVAAAGSFPWKNKEIFVDQSPLFSADKINTPILLCHGQSDTNVPVGESVQMFAALKILGKPVELLTFKAEDHFISEYNRRKQWMKSHLAWFERWLKDDGDWWTALYPESEKNW